MKKFIDLTTIAVLVAVAAGFVNHYDVGKELGDLLKVVMHKLAPWINTAIYS
jgi:hypothetical protein